MRKQPRPEEYQVKGSQLQSLLTKPESIDKRVQAKKKEAHEHHSVDID